MSNVGKSLLAILSQFKPLAEYNKLMNQRQYDAAAKLPVQVLHEDAGAFFKYELLASVGSAKNAGSIPLQSGAKARRLRCIFASVIILLILPAYKTHAAPAAISAHISIKTDSLKTKLFTEAGTLRNISNKKISIIVWTQYGWSWVSDNPAVSPGIEALNNFPRTVTLGPGQEYRADVEMHADMRIHKPVRFHLGFVPNADRPVSLIPGIKKHKDVIWSNPVILR